MCGIRCALGSCGRGAYQTYPVPPISSFPLEVAKSGPLHNFASRISSIQAITPDCHVLFNGFTSLSSLLPTSGRGLCSLRIDANLIDHSIPAVIPLGPVDAMPAFQPPVYVRSKNRKWFKTAKPGFCHPERLWNEYWQRYNTITIPILDEDAYFADALAAARRAENRKHLEEILAETSKQRRADLERLLSEIAVASIRLRHPFPSEVAHGAAFKVGSTGSLDSFLQFVCGFTFGWPGRDEEDGSLQIEQDGRVEPGGQVEEGNVPASDSDDVDIEDENGRHASPDPWDYWESDEDDAFDQWSYQRVTECPATDAEDEEKQPLQKVPATGRSTSAAEAQGGPRSRRGARRSSGAKYDRGYVPRSDLEHAGHTPKTPFARPRSPHATTPSGGGIARPCASFPGLRRHLSDR